MTEALYVPLRGVIRLVSSLEVDTSPAVVFDRMLSVTEALLGTCEPLALDLTLAGREPGLPLLEPEPASSAWQLVEAGLPADVVVRAPDFPGAHVVETPALTPDVARAWAQRALALPDPRPELESTPASLLVSYVRARVSGAPDEYTVLDGADGIPQPLEQRHGATWVLAPPRDLLMQPPVSWRVQQEDELYAEVWINWSPWADGSTLEGGAVRAAIERLQANGWRLRAPFHALELTP
jgi:hypothetical protein